MFKYVSKVLENSRTRQHQTVKTKNVHLEIVCVDMLSRAELTTAAETSGALPSMAREVQPFSEPTRA